MKKITILLFLFLGINSSYSQDTCSSAVIVSAGTFTVGAINGTDVPSPVCAPNGAIPVANIPAGEWYKYTPSQNYTVTLTTDLTVNNGKDTRVHIYTGACGSLTCFAGDDDTGTVGTGYLSIVTFNVVAGTTYTIAFDNRWNSSGFDFQITEQTIVPSPVTFTATSISSSSVICSVTDMNGDFLDDIVTVGTNQMNVLTQNTTGGFTTSNYALPALTATPSWSITAGDFDKNGFNDLVFGSGSRLTVIKANATGTGYTEIPYPQNIFTQRANFIDINNDGHLDLFACHDVDQSHAYRNDGAGNLNFDISLFPTLDAGGNYASIWSDYDNDGDQDMYLAKCRGGAPAGDPQRINLLYKNNNDGTFTESGAAAGVNDGSQSWSTAIEDFDNDGDMDFLVSNISDQNKLYKNNGDGTFTDVYSTSGINAQVGSWELQAADFNNDGLIDFLWQNGKELYINNGNLTFTGYDLPFSEGGIGDLNNDGFLDVQFGSNVYYNVPNANNWVKVKLEGVTSNRNGIGARVEVYGSWGKQMREIRSGHGFSHQSSMNAHFGIGTATTITKIVVKWPSGTIDTYNNPALNQSFMIVEGATLNVTDFSKDGIGMYPNPTTDFLYIKKINGNTFKTAKIYDLTGRLISYFETIKESISVENLNSGTYLLLLKDENGNGFSQKFIKE